MNSILYYTKESNPSEAELQEIEALRKTCTGIAIKNGAIRPENAKSFETNFERVVESGSTVGERTNGELKPPIIIKKPNFNKEKV